MLDAGYWNDLRRHHDLDEIWMAHPLVRDRINLRVSGDAAVWPTTWLLSKLGQRRLERTLSIGCGVGNLERDLVAQQAVASITGVDVNPATIEEARRLAAAQSAPGTISYVCADAREHLRSESSLDAIFFHESLHHFDELDDLLAAAHAALVPGGLLYLDEYVGPSRDEWSAKKLLLPNLVYYRLPRQLRRPRIVRAPINREDPTEALRSSEILAAVSRHFEIVERRDYGGNLLAIVYPNLRRPSRDDGEAARATFDAAITFLLDLEEAILRNQEIAGEPSFYSVILARRN